jgi:hypothetical protein
MTSRCGTTTTYGSEQYCLVEFTTRLLNFINTRTLIHTLFTTITFYFFSVTFPDSNIVDLSPFTPLSLRK